MARVQSWVWAPHAAGCRAGFGYHMPHLQVYVGTKTAIRSHKARLLLLSWRGLRPQRNTALVSV